MRLKRLETYGFKSFADRMTFDFEQGITAIIGPNGCGKSNVVDSLKWVVGEQSAKALRGAEMADVIFNGCATRRPMALAEVSLVLDQMGNAHGLDGEDEVAITRRLTKDGQSSYYLNGKPCRLKDIRELLMDTGVGTSAYSVIEQGRIGFILEASTKDRRALLEEAAGISRYKARRKVAIRKLDRVQIDLERIGQLLAEVERRLRSVKKQAETALKFQELNGILRDLRMVFALEEFGRLSGERKQHSDRAEQVEAQALEANTQLAEAEAGMSEREVALVGLEDKLRDSERERAEAMSRRDVAASRLRDAKSRLIEIDQQEQDDRQALENAGGRLDALRQELATTEQNLSESNAENDGGINSLYTEKRAELDELINEISQLITQVDERKNRQVECLREISRIEAEQGRLVSARNQLIERRTRLEQRSQEHEGAMTGAVERQQQATTLVQEREVAVEEAHGKLDGLIRAREESQTQGQQLDQRLNDLRHEEGRAEVRLRLLSEYEKKNEGLFRGAKAIVKEMDRLPGVLGLVADCFRVEKKYERAIEVALGGSAQHIITETQEAAKDAISLLRRERRGRATFLPLDDVQGREKPQRRWTDGRGVVGVAVDLIDYENRYNAAFSQLLGGYIVCETMDDAIGLRRNGCRHPIVTLDGETVSAGGAMTGGRTQGDEAGGIVSRKNEIRRLEEQITEMAEQRQSAAAERDAIKKAAFDASVAVEDHRKATQQLERELGEAKTELMKAERDRLHVEEFSSSFGNELEEIAAELSSLEADTRDLEGQGHWFSDLRNRLETELTRIQAQVGERAQIRDRLNEEINTLRVDLATTEERREALRNHALHLRRSLQELEDSRDERQRRLDNHERNREEFKTIINDQEAVHKEAADLVEAQAAGLDGLIKERDEIRNSLEEQRQSSRALATRARGLERERADLELKLGELRVRIEGLADRIRDDYELELAEAFEHWERPANLDLPKVRRDLADTERQLANLGPVNLAAIDELAEVEAKRDFLARQHEDLSTAAAKLSDIIEQINTTSRRLFKNTYRAVRKNFQELFRKLYGGGKADLILETEEGEDILECGVEIIAQPPGKQPKSITLLSGGEKALTAIALLFGVYQIKPSPFCVLDEVDAPLDESNTDVYCKMVEEFCKDSQFIVITHNKRTMQYANAIYGITQSERGVSQKISVKLDSIDQHGELLATEQGAGPFSD